MLLDLEVIEPPVRHASKWAIEAGSVRSLNKASTGTLFYENITA